MNKNPKCPKCNKASVKYGKRNTKLQSIQVYLCKSCNKRFSLSTQLSKTYSMQIILNSISNYNLGYTLNQTQEKIQRIYNTKIPISTISSWLSQYKDICTFAKLRKRAIKDYSPKNMLQKQTLSHIQPYTFKYHKAKLDILLKENPKFIELKDYIEKINSKEFPHHIFTHHQENSKNNRASNLDFKYLDVKINKKENLSSKLAKLALNSAKTNKERHQKLQDFFLINDSTTIATEIPTYLTNWDAAYYKNKKCFVFPLNSYQTPITGHIDILQISNSLIYILDYKPDSHLKQIQDQAIQQLTIYAMALSKKLNLPLSDFKAAWFDENICYDFFPLHAVYEKQARVEKVKSIIVGR